jgi:hypothetical protein
MNAFARGIHYRNPQVYKFLTALKLRQDYHKRFQIAANYVREGESVLDICAGSGEFRDFLPPGCAYQSVDASPSFHPDVVLNLHENPGLPNLPRANIVTMIISLYQFQNTTLDTLLENFKKTGQRVVIVEEAPPRRGGKWREVLGNYLCSTPYYRPTRLFLAEEFNAIMKRHGYDCRRCTDRYWIGFYSGHRL